MENLLEGLTTTAQSRGFVPNKFPTLQHAVPYRIAIIGEAPGADEVAGGQPFVGVSGRWLDYLLNRVGIMRAACFLGNISQHRPPNNDITKFNSHGPEIQSGITQLGIDLETFGPKLCLLLGGTALATARGVPPNWSVSTKNQSPEASVSKQRGTLFIGAPNTPFAGRKCISTFHPASSLRVYEQTPLLLFDLKRARTEAERADLVLPTREIYVAKDVSEVVNYFSQLHDKPLRCGTDIEGYVNNLTCISFADNANRGFVIPFTGPYSPDRGSNYWSAEDELTIWLEIKRFLENPNIPKVLQNGLYDRFVLAYTYGILIHGVTDDTMCKHWEVYCELPKALALQTSIYTTEPYYKDERGSDNWDEFWTYSGKDSCVTLEACDKQDTMLHGSARNHYQFNVQMQNALLYLELRGMRYDYQGANQIAEKVKQEVYRLQHIVNNAAGCALNVQTEQEALTLLKESMCLKRNKSWVMSIDQVPHNVRKPFIDNGSVYRAVELCKQGFPFDDAKNGEFSMLIEQHMNTASPDQMQQFLYGQLAMPTQYKRRKNADDERTATTDVLSLLKLYKKNQNPVLKALLLLSRKLTQLETLTTKQDPDGRIRCSYNIVGTVTGRLSCSKSPTRSGYNLQTVTKKHRHLFLADEGYYFFQCDLSGADGWTVAAHCARLGDSTMLEDYLAGLKPAKLITLMYNGRDIRRDSRESLRATSKEVANDWLYMAGKRVQHGSNYDMQPPTMSDQILMDGWKYGDDFIYVEPTICAHLQQLYFQRYPGITSWHRWVADEIKNKHQLTSANGHTRRIFGRPNDHNTLKAILSDEPQTNTTYVCNRAAYNLWHDRENRRNDGSLIIEPLHQVHDALCGQFPIDREEWFVRKIRQYFANTITIAGQSICIPFEGAYGRSWGELDHEI